MVNTNPHWATVIAQNLNQSEIAIVACVIGMIFFMKYNQHESKNKANRYIGISISFSLVVLVIFRIYKGVL
jgi:hypothetical protein